MDIENLIWFNDDKNEIKSILEESYQVIVSKDWKLKEEIK